MLKIIYAGSPDISVPTLKTLARLQLQTDCCSLEAVITNPDTAKGRHKDLTPTPIGTTAEEICAGFSQHGAVPPVVFKLNCTAKDNSIDTIAYDRNCSLTTKNIADIPDAISPYKIIKQMNPDLLISFAYGAIFTKEFIDLFRLSGINIHPSLLPKYRGATPIPAAILNMDKETGITIQKLSTEVDAGDILFQEKIILTGTETSETLSVTVAQKSAEMLEKFILSYEDYFSNAKKQNNNDATFCGLIEKSDTKINWNNATEKICAQIRAYTFYHLCYTFFNEQLLFILEALPLKTYNNEITNVAPGTVLGNNKKEGILIKTGSGVIVVRRLQLQARKALDHNSFLNGIKNFVGSTLG